MTSLGSIRWILLALLGLAVAAGVSVAASQLVSQRIGLAAEPVSAGKELAPPKHESGNAPQGGGDASGRPRPAGPRSPVTTTTTTTTSTVPSSDADDHHDSPGAVASTSPRRALRAARQGASRLTIRHVRALARKFSLDLTLAWGAPFGPFRTLAQTTAREEISVRNMRTLIAVGAAGLGLGALGGYAANSTGGQGTTTTAADLKPKVHTKVIHHTKHVKPKHPVDAIGPPKNAGAPAPSATPAAAAPPPTSAPPVSTASSGSTTGTATAAPVTTGTSGSSSSTSSGSGVPVSSGTSGSTSSGSGSSGGPTTHTSGGGGSTGGGGRTDDAHKRRR